MKKSALIGWGIACLVMLGVYIFWEPAWDHVGTALDRPVTIGCVLVCWFLLGAWYEKAVTRFEKLEAKIDSLILQATPPK